MNSHYQQLFSNMPVREPSERISLAVMRRIERDLIRRSRSHEAAHGALAIGAVIAAVPAFQYLSSGLAQSGFSQYASLLFSDGSLALTHWKDIALSMADSLPVMASIVFVSIMLILANSLRGLIRNRSSLSTSRQHAQALGIAA